MYSGQIHYVWVCKWGKADLIFLNIKKYPHCNLTLTVLRWYYLLNSHAENFDEMSKKNYDFAGAGEQSRDLSHARQVSVPLHYGGRVTNPTEFAPHL